MSRSLFAVLHSRFGPPVDPRERRLFLRTTLGVGAGLLLSASGVSAAPQLRTQVTQRGDFILIGNTLGQECAAGTPLPIVGAVGNCGLSTSDTSADVSWRSD